MQGGHGHGGYGYGGYGYGYGAGGYVYDAGAYGSAAGGYYSANGYPPAAPAYGYEDPLTVGRRAVHDFPAPQLDGLELQPSEACPKNYVVFDQTYTSSSVTFHPSLAHKLGGLSASGHDSRSGAGAHEANDDDTCSVRQKEDSEEIDALLSSEDGGDDDDVASTGRSTPGSGYGRDDDGSSPDSACSSGRGGKPRKKERIKKMMRALKGIVPGGDRMDTPAALDEAVWYLRSLKLEAAKKLGPRRSDS